MNYSELLQLAKGWGNFVSDRINIGRLRSNIISHCKKADLISIYEMESNSEVWSDWIKQNNEYAINDRKAIEAGGGDYLNFIAIILQKK